MSTTFTPVLNQLRYVFRALSRDDGAATAEYVITIMATVGQIERISG